MGTKKFLYRISLLLAVAAVVALVVAELHFYTAPDGQDNRITPEKFTKYKLEKRGTDTSRKPSEWFTLQRAYPYDQIPFPAYKRALERATELRSRDVGTQVGTWVAAGPSNVGGRITDLAAHPDYPNIIYAGAAAGGIFKSTDGGDTWTPISDAVPSLSIGDIEIDPFDPDVLYLGTGESNTSGDSYAGTGIYKTTNGGSSWEFMGLPESRHIGRIVIDPTNPQRVFAAAMGTLFGTNPDRGVYRSLDGGESWEQVLFVTDSTSAADLAINPDNPDIIFASMWERIRSPSRRRVGGLTTGIYRTTDGGDSWELLTNGLPSPSTTNGRIGLAVSPANPSVVYASMVDHPGYLVDFWRSTDGGDSWQDRLISPNQGEFSGFGWYFGRIWAHPTDANTAYFADVGFWRSTDGAAHWYDYSGSMHVDMHALYQDPGNPNYMVNGNDGGIFISTNGGNSWTKSYDLPITQFYAITIDDLNPHRLYGGTQDNSTPRTLGGGYDDWDVIFYGDGFYCNVDFTDSDIIYAEAQYGYLGKSNNLGGNWDVIVDGIDWTEQTNWSTPVVMSPHNHNVLFYGAQRLYKTTNAGDYWNAISPDLTGGDDPGNLVYGTITTVDQSSLDADVIWVGTDDSRVWVTSNGGGNWNMVSISLPNRWCTRVTADVFDPATAYVAFSGYKIDELLPHIFKTTDYGQSWVNISGDLEDIPVNDILPDPIHSGWLYVGSDFGVFYTSNGGEQWEMLGDNHPISPVFDIAMHNDTRKLVSGTHGRSMYSYDLEQLEGSSCEYSAGDCDYNGVPLELSDVIIMIAAYRTPLEPDYTCDCPPHGENFAPQLDPNGNCVESELSDVVAVISGYRGSGEVSGCEDCPPNN
jgi:photosystem II stability/assembly factor-like uncharacterized protein